MVYTGTIVTEAEIDLMAGKNVDTTGNTQANKNILSAQAESYLSNLMRYNVVDNYGSLNEDVKRMLSEWAARYCAVALIAYNMAGFTSSIEAEDMMQVHIYRMQQIEELLKQQNTINFIINGGV